MAQESKVLHFTDADFEAQVVNSTVPVLVDFTATWCGPCKALAPAIEEIAGSYAGRAKVGKVDIDECPDTAMKYQIRGVPTLLLFKDGKVLGQSVGLVGKSKIADLIDRALG
jgi:thioredoxin 1